MTREYLRALSDQVSRYSGTGKDVVALAPAYARLMFTLLKDPRLSPRQRLWVDAAIAYLVSPNDVIPEDEVGPYGYLDDIFCCAYVAKLVAEELGWDAVQEGWDASGSIREVSLGLLAREHELLGHSGDDVLRFAGLDEPLEAADRQPAPRG